MATRDELVTRIYRGPRGPRVAAIFDYDGTLIQGFSAQAFYDHRIRRRELGPVELLNTIAAMARGIADEEDFAAFLEVSLGAWKGKTVSELDALGEQLLRDVIASRLHHELLAIVEAHRAMGHTLALASSATRFQVAPMARELGIEHVLCTEVETIDGVVTGRTDGPSLWASGKADAVRRLARANDLDLDESYAYSNGAEDVRFLELVAYPTAVSPDRGLRRTARERGWPILQCRRVGGDRPGPADVARTAGFYGGFAGSFATALGVGLLRRSRQATLDLAFAMGADVGLALGGVDVDVVTGAEYLWSARPCVFVFNHQSNLDAAVVMKLVRDGYTGVAKAEAKSMPLFGPMLQFAGVAFVERGNIEQAKEAIAPAIRKVREERVSLVIAPEGTRTPTPRLSEFKKGPFHIAMQAEVPMVPIVLRNTGEILWRKSQLLRPGTVEVAVLAPVDTSSWTPETVGEHRDEVKAMFDRTLRRWPGDPSTRLLEESVA